MRNWINLFFAFFISTTLNAEALKVVDRVPVMLAQADNSLGKQARFPKRYLCREFDYLLLPSIF